MTVFTNFSSLCALLCCAVLLYIPRYNKDKNEKRLMSLQKQLVPVSKTTKRQKVLMVSVTAEWSPQRVNHSQGCSGPAVPTSIPRTNCKTWS